MDTKVSFAEFSITFRLFRLDSYPSCNKNKYDSSWLHTVQLAIQIHPLLEKEVRASIVGGLLNPILSSSMLLKLINFTLETRSYIPHKHKSLKPECTKSTKYLVIDKHRALTRRDVTVLTVTDPGCTCLLFPVCSALNCQEKALFKGAEFEDMRRHMFEADSLTKTLTTGSPS